MWRIAYHGVTLGALALTGVPRMTEPFGPPAIDVVRVVGHGELSGRPTPAGTRRRRPRGCWLELEERRPRRRPRDRGDDHRRARPERGRVPPSRPRGTGPGGRVIADRHGIPPRRRRGHLRLRAHRRVARSTRFGAVPDLITTAKGLTSAYAPMGAVLVKRPRRGAALRGARDPAAWHHLRRAPGGVRRSRCATSSSSSGLAVLENVRAREAQGAGRAGSDPRPTCRSSATCAAPFSSGCSSWSPDVRRGGASTPTVREALVRGFPPRWLHEALAHRAPGRHRGAGAAPGPAARQRRRPSSTRCSAPQSRAVLTDASARFFA